MSKAVATARYLIHLAHSGPEPDPLTHLRLQKLLYYVQGYALALRGEPLFDAPIEAWKNGPVIREVYHVFADCEDQPIPSMQGSDAGALSEQSKAFIRSIWEHHKQYSASELWRKTHDERPWKAVWGSRSMADRCSDEISHDLLKAFFEEEWERRCLPGFDLNKMHRIEQQVRDRKWTPLSEVLRRRGLEARVRPTAHA